MLETFIENPPPWLAALGAEALGGDLGVRLLDSAQWRVADPDDFLDTTIRVPQLVAADNEIRAGKILVAQGPATTVRFLEGDGPEVRWYVDPAAPDRLWCALAYYHPGWMWIPVEPTTAAMAEVLGGMFPKPHLDRTTLTSNARGFVGFLSDVRLPNVYSGDMVRLNGAELARYYTTSPFVEFSWWGSAHVDDPLADDPSPVSPLVAGLVAQQLRTSQQLLGRVPSMTWRARHSRSYVSFEIHARNQVFARIHYRPAPASHRAVVEWYNEQVGTDFPADVPLDAVGALTGFGFASEESLAHNLTDPQSTDQLCDALWLYAAFWEGDIAKTRRLLDYVAHPERAVRLEVIRVARLYNLPFVLYQAAQANADEAAFVLGIERVIDSGCPADDMNVFEDEIDGVATFVDEQGEQHDGQWPDEGYEDEEDEDEENGESA